MKPRTLAAVACLIATGVAISYSQTLASPMKHIVAAVSGGFVGGALVLSGGLNKKKGS